MTHNIDESENGTVSNENNLSLNDKLWFEVCQIFQKWVFIDAVSNKEYPKEVGMRSTQNRIQLCFRRHVLLT